jgi:hypothetical protein
LHPSLQGDICRSRRGLRGCAQAINETRPSAEILKARPETTSDLEAPKRPADSFTAKIDELTRQNHAFMAELERWRSTALNAEALNREWGASLDVGQLSVNTLQQEKERMKESYRQNVIAVNFFRTKAVEQMRLSRSFSVPSSQQKRRSLLFALIQAWNVIGQLCRSCPITG